MMRVITGSAKGRRLETLPGNAVTRPTAENVKEALFSMLQFDIEGKKVLDLFAGSGQLGIEALSRGAADCVFIEADRNACAVVERNIQKCGFEGVSRILPVNALGYASSCSGFDLVFLDPPYNQGIVNKVLPLLEKGLSKNALVACETSASEELPESAGCLNVILSRRYGKTKITLYRKD